MVMEIVFARPDSYCPIYSILNKTNKGWNEMSTSYSYAVIFAIFDSYSPGNSNNSITLNAICNGYECG